METADGVAVPAKGKWKRDAGANKDELERIFIKYGLDPALIKMFGFHNADSCIIALHLLHVTGYILPHTLRQLARDVLTYHKVKDWVLQKYCDFYIKQAVPCFKSSYVLFGVFVCRNPKILCTSEKVEKAANWVNHGMCTGHSIASVLNRCCKVTVEAAVRIGAMPELVATCFNERMPVRVQNQWRAIINGSGRTAREMFSAEIEKQFPEIADYEDLNSNTTHESNVYVNRSVLNPDITADFSPDVTVDTTIEQAPRRTVDEFDAGGETDEENDEDESDELMLNNLGDFYERLKMASAGQINVLTMADIIREVSGQEHPSDGIATNAPMPRNAIQRFYFLLEKMIDDRTVDNPLYNTKRLMLLQMSTHSKKVIDFCKNRLKHSVQALTAEMKQQLNIFFWERYLTTPLKFRPYAVSSILVTLCSTSHMNSSDVVAKLCAMTADGAYIGTRVNEHCDAVLHDLLVNRSVSVDFRRVFQTVRAYEKFEFYRTWKVILDGVFLNVSLPVPLIYFKFRDDEILDAALEEMRKLIRIRFEGPLIQFAQRLHFSLSILEMCHSMHLLRLGPETDDFAEFAKRKTSEVIHAMLDVWSICPLLSFRQRISNIAGALL